MDWMVAISSLAAVMMGLGALFVRMKAAKKPTSARKIIMPPLFMSTGALMFVFPMFRVTPLELLEAAAVGCLFSLLLIKTSNFEIRGHDIYLKRSKAFPIILMSLLVIRIIGKLVLSTTIDIGQLGGMFFILAFAMILPWRMAMYKKYITLKRQLPDQPIPIT
ncbi:cytochrome c biogenesis protein CcdC [Domibacillus indicus]|uniref:CcdC family protein n=1 Tax=Domibacillus TaxID=1433999 RepID=UPI0020418F4F|nr:MULTISPECIES: cytochrome c biogenesis protein CcdC [Domibacillus]MCM3789537.1 cytochrome c biogenesis protein CcdC [Domibacillus indicus]WNS79370.1 cytochrome c biogenesis protein CcdC [Domibacillus sp. DTU_2020_1001157_1_SI_ALB_TIR_016]